MKFVRPFNALALPVLAVLAACSASDSTPDVIVPVAMEETVSVPATSAPVTEITVAVSGTTLDTDDALTSRANYDLRSTAAINGLRRSNGLSMLTYNTTLQQAAQAHAEDMAARGFFSHTGSDGSDIGKRIRRTGYLWCFAAENIAQGQRDLESVMAAWSNSPGHRANMLHIRAEEFAIYEAADFTWVMVLAEPC